MTTSNPNTSEKILVLGHTGLLGGQVLEYFRHLDRDVITTDLRWPSSDFKEFVEKFEGIIVNCVGTIPQSGSTDYSVNYELPLFLLDNRKKFLHPDTDCVFSGNIPPGDSYEKDAMMDAEGSYANSKIRLVEEAKRRDVNNLRIIRTSIVGYDKGNKSLLSWFLKNAEEKGKCQGYVNHMWNGITTLQWSKVASELIDNWENHDWITQVGSNHVSKYELLMMFSEVFRVPCEVEPVHTAKNVNKCLKSDITVPDLRQQILDLAAWRTTCR